MNKKELYIKAYEMLNRITPLKLDCGALCDKACCKGDEDTGMYLFPGEEAMYESPLGFLTIKPSNLKFGNGQKVLLAICQGNCSRDSRPLACRIFPLAPYITDNDILTIKMDPRAEKVCPIAMYGERKKLNQEFVKNIRNVFQLLIQDADIKAYLEDLSRILDEFYKFAPRKG